MDAQLAKVACKVLAPVAAAGAVAAYGSVVAAASAALPWVAGGALIIAVIKD